MKNILMTATTLGLLLATESYGKAVQCPAADTVKVGIFCNNNHEATIGGNRWKVTEETKGNLPGYGQIVTKNRAKLDEADSSAPKAPENACPYRYTSSSSGKSYQVHITPADSSIAVSKGGQVAEVKKYDTCPIVKKAKVVTGTPAEKAEKILSRLVASASKDDGDALETAKQNALIFAQTCFVGKSGAELLVDGDIKKNYTQCLTIQSKTSGTVLDNVHNFLAESSGASPDILLLDVVTDYLLKQSMNDYIAGTLRTDKKVSSSDAKRRNTSNEQTVKLAYNGAKQDLTAKLK